MNQFEQEGQKRQQNGRQSCYSANCRSNGHTGIYKCYSSNCRASNSTQSTKLPHKLVFDGKSKDLKSKSSTSKGNKDRYCTVPKTHSFSSSRASKPNILILPKHSVRLLARNIYDLSRIEGFSITARGSHFIWPYPCLRPLFNCCWRYQVMAADQRSIQFGFAQN
uniref:Uncharacterized protein n=1 Tax=Romanomermis culicivorax TaxID=13658 RepID=A0A915I854_ROMCU